MVFERLALTVLVVMGGTHAKGCLPVSEIALGAKEFFGNPVNSVKVLCLPRVKTDALL